MKKIFSAWVSLLLKIYPLILILGFLLTYLALPHMAALLKNISTDPVDLLPQDNPSVQALLKIRSKYESRTGFGVVLESPRPENTKALIEEIKRVFKGKPGVHQVVDKKIGYDYIYNHKMLFLDLEDLETIRDRIDRKIQKTKLGSFYVDFEDEDSKGAKTEELNFEDLEKKYRSKYGAGGDQPYYVSPNGKTFLVYVESEKGGLSVADLAALQGEIEKTLNTIDLKKFDPEMNLYFTGITKVHEYRSLMRDLKTAGLISACLIFLPLLLRFRRPDHVLMVFLPMALGIPISFWISSHWISKLNVTTSFLFAILGGLGIETGIHVFSRYVEKRRARANQRAALLDLYHYLGPAVLTSIASLAVTFMLLMFSDFRGFSEFGLISGIGLWTIFLLYFTFFPALLILAEKAKFLKFKEVEDLNMQMRPFKPSFSFVKTLLFIFSIFTVFSLIVIPGVKFEYNSKKIRADLPENRLAKMKQREAEGGRANNPALLLVQSEEEAAELKQVIDQRKLQNPNSILESSRSYYSLVPDKQPEKMKVIDEMELLLADDSLRLVGDEHKQELEDFKTALHETKMVSRKDVPQDLEDMFSGKAEVPGKLFFIQAKPHLEMDDGRNAIQFATEVEKLKTSFGTYFPSNDAIVYGEVLKTMFRDSKWILLISVLSLSFFVYLDFRSIKKTSLVMFSILSGVFWVMGVIYLIGFPINLYNMVMIPSIMGMSIDNSIHIYHSYEEQGRGSLGKVLATAGLSCLLASFTNASGFLGLLFCHHGGLRSMGILASIGLATCLISTLVFLPMMLQFFESRKINVRD